MMSNQHVYIVGAYIIDLASAALYEPHDGKVFQISQDYYNGYIECAVIARRVAANLVLQ